MKSLDFNDPAVIEKMNQDIKRIKQIAEKEGKTPLEVSNEEIRRAKKRFEDLLTSSLEEIKKREAGEKYPNMQSFDGIYTASEILKDFILGLFGNALASPMLQTVK